jgi:hypothetical protein
MALSEMPKLYKLMAFLFHEITSPMSALTTGVELLEDDVAPDQELCAMMQKASERLKSRLNFLRFIFTAGTPTTSRTILSNLLHKFQAHENDLTLTFRLEEETFPTDHARGLLCLMLWVQKSLYASEINLQLAHKALHIQWMARTPATQEAYQKSPLYPYIEEYLFPQGGKIVLDNNTLTVAFSP